MDEAQLDLEERLGRGHHEAGDARRREHGLQGHHQAPRVPRAPVPVPGGEKGELGEVGAARAQGSGAERDRAVAQDGDEEAVVVVAVSDGRRGDELHQVFPGFRDQGRKRGPEEFARVGDGGDRAAIGRRRGRQLQGVAARDGEAGRGQAV